MKKLWLVILFITISLWARSAMACSCGGSPSPSGSYNFATAVFVGTVRKTEPNSDGKNEYEGEQQAWVQVEELFKGEDQAEIVFHQPGHNCAPKFKTGERWLIYASFDKKTKMWEVQGCDRSTHVENAPDDLLYLRALPESAKRSRLAGVLSHYEDVPKEGFRRLKYLAGIKVRITNETSAWEVITNADGVYELYDLPAGKYKIQPEIPAGMKIRFANPSGSRFESGVEVKEGASVGSNFIFSANNLIKGKIIDPDGKPLARVCLDLIPADIPAEQLRYFRVLDCTKEDGSFELKEMPPGKYLIVANKNGKPSGDAPFAQVYYPGVLEKERASVITIGTGDQREGYNIRVPAVLPTITIQGVLVHSDETPAAEEHVSFRSAAADGKLQTLASGTTDKQGRFSITVLKGANGILTGGMYSYAGEYVNCPQLELLIKAKKQNVPEIETPPIPLDALNDISGLRLMFSFPACQKQKEK